MKYLVIALISVISFADLKLVKTFDGMKAYCETRPDVIKYNFGTVFYNKVVKFEYEDRYEFQIEVSMHKCVFAPNGAVQYINTDLYELFNMFYFNHETKQVDSYEARYEKLEIIASLSPGFLFVDIAPVSIIEGNRGTARLIVLKENIGEAKHLSLNLRGMAITYYDDEPKRRRVSFGGARVLNLFNAHAN